MIPDSIYFLALSQAPPPLFKKRAMRMPVEVANIKNAQTTLAPSKSFPYNSPITRNITP